jgi:hypothetical protein
MLTRHHSGLSPVVMKFPFLFFAAALAVTAESPLGKIHKYDTATGKVEIRITPGTQVPGKIYLDNGTKRALCNLKTTLHTKVTCQAQKSLALRPGMAAYANAAAEKTGADDTSPIPEPNSPGNLLGTKWKGVDSENRLYEFIFDKDGILEYESPSGRFRNGSWKQEGDTLRMEMNNHYSDYEGTVSGDSIAGKAKNVTGKTWTWRVTRQAPNP